MVQGILPSLHKCPRKWAGWPRNEGSPPSPQAVPPQQAPVACWWMAHSLCLPQLLCLSPRAVRGVLPNQEGGCRTSVPMAFLRPLAGQRQAASPLRGWLIAFDSRPEPTFRHEARRQLQATAMWPRSTSSVDLATCKEILSGAKWICPCDGNRAFPGRRTVPRHLANRAANAGWRVRIPPR